MRVRWAGSLGVFAGQVRWAGSRCQDNGQSRLRRADRQVRIEVRIWATSEVCIEMSGDLGDRNLESGALVRRYASVARYRGTRSLRPLWLWLPPS